MAENTASRSQRAQCFISELELCVCEQTKLDFREEILVKNVGTH